MKRSVSIFIWLLGTALTLSKVIISGRPSREIWWDDSAYILSGYDRFSTLKNSGLLNYLTSFISSPPHSVYTELVSLTSSMFFGTNVVTIYVIHTLVVSCLVLLILKNIFVGQTNTALMVGGAVMSSPIMFFISNEFRPDTIFSLMVCLGAQQLTRTEQDLTTRLSRFWIFCMLLVYVKPTFILTSFFIFLAGTIYANWKLLRKGAFSQIFDAVKNSLPVLLLTSPLTVLVIADAVRYVLEVKFGAAAKYWVSDSAFAVWKSSLVDATFYTQWVFPLLLSACLLFLFLSKFNPRSEIKSIAFFWCWLGLVLTFASYVSSMYSIFFGFQALLPALFGFIAIISATRSRSANFLRKTPWLRGASVLQLGILISVGISGVAYLVPAKQWEVHSELESPNRFNQFILETILRDCEKDSACFSSSLANKSLPAISMGTLSEVNSVTFLWEARTIGLTGGIDSVGQTTVAKEWISDAKDSARYIILENPSRKKNAWDFELEKAQWLSDLRVDPHFICLPTAKLHDQYYIFRRVS